jgi:hypothetical protein
VSAPPAGPPLDAELQNRVRELGRREAAAAPPFARVLRGSPESAPRPSRPGVARWRPLAPVALGLALLLAALAWRWPLVPDEHEPLAEMQALPPAAAQAWGVPTDGLLDDAAAARERVEAERLSREIEELLAR